MDSSLNFPKQAVSSLYNNYARSLFSETMQMLISQRAISLQERDILALVMGVAKSRQNFFCKSFMIYLCHGLIGAKEGEAKQRIKKQLFFELSVKLIMEGAARNVRFSSDEPLFSVCLNTRIEGPFDEISLEEGGIGFLLEGKSMRSASKNTFLSITSDIDFLEEDRNPFNINNDHPDQKFVAYDLGGVEREKWVLQFRDAYALIKEKVPEIYEEIYAFLDAVAPHGYQPAKQMSSSYSKSPGILYLSYTDDTTTQAEALIHEVHHTIFNIIQWKYPLYTNDDALKYYSAYRPDARHIKGCFLGLHAFVGVQNFYRKLSDAMDDPKIIDKFLFFYLKNEITISVLKRHALFTREGTLLFDDICLKFDQDKEFFSRLLESRKELCMKAQKDVNAHFEEAKLRNAILLY